MINTTRKLATVTVLLVGAAAACGGSPHAKPSPTPVEVPSLALGVAGSGRVLTDGTGETLYVNVTTRNSCDSYCMSAWPPVLRPPISTPQLSQGLEPALIGSVPLPGGLTGVTYGGFLLHRYSGDTSPGDANGEGVQSAWYTLTATGHPTSQ
jgi:predicted lipoprotein with Yx(FWY)xxD motif